MLIVHIQLYLVPSALWLELPADDLTWLPENNKTCRWNPPFPFASSDTTITLTSSSLALTSAICCCKDRTYSCSVLLDKTLQQPSQLSYLLTVLHCRAVSLFLSSLEFFIQSERSQSLLFYSQVISNDRQTDSRELCYIQTKCMHLLKSGIHTQQTNKTSLTNATHLSSSFLADSTS